MIFRDNIFNLLFTENRDLNPMRCHTRIVWIVMHEFGRLVGLHDECSNVVNVESRPGNRPGYSSYSSRNFFDSSYAVKYPV